MKLHKALDLNGVWHYGYPIFNKSHTAVTINGNLCHINTLCVYTVHKDRNQEKIFVNDKVQININNDIHDGTIFIKDNTPVIVFDRKSLNKYFSHTDIMFWKKFITVTGNLYNKNFIKEEQ